MYARFYAGDLGYLNVEYEYEYENETKTKTKLMCRMNLIGINFMANLQILERFPSSVLIKIIFLWIISMKITNNELRSEIHSKMITSKLLYTV